MAYCAPLVAIFTPVLNGEAYLAETLESVQSLDYPNLIHVVLDNASTDATPAIIARFHGRRVPLLVRRNETTVPMASNWNAALALVPREAKYFRILCADDTLYPDAITRLVEVAERDPQIGLVGSLWRAEGLCGEELPADRDVFDGKEVMLGYLRREHMALSGMHVLVRHRAVDTHRLFYDPSLASFDTDANMRLCMQWKYGFVRAELGTWRIHADSTTARKATRSFAHETCWLTLLDRYGPAVLGFREYIACRTAYRNHLLRRLLKARFRNHDAPAFRRCLEKLQLSGDPVGFGDFPAALAEWSILALRRRRQLVGLPRSRTPPDYRVIAGANASEF